MLFINKCLQVVPGGKDEHGTEANVSLEELDQRDQDYRADLDHNQRPSHIVMLRMLPPNVTTNEVSVVCPLKLLLYGAEHNLPCGYKLVSLLLVDPSSTPRTGNSSKRGSTHEEQVIG